jgi:hypothetical protein
MSKILLSMPDLRRRALAEIRKQPGCHNVQDLAINRIRDERTETNWSLCVPSAGAADANTAARAGLHVQRILRRDALKKIFGRRDPNYLGYHRLSSG